MTPQLLGGMQGSVAETSFYSDPYVYSVQTIGSGASTQYRLIRWTTAGSSTNFTSRILSNFSLPWGFVNWGGGVLGYGGYVADFEANVMVYMVGIAPISLGVYKGTWMEAVDLNTGQMLWNRTYEDTRYSTACLIADHGMVACLMEQGYYSAYDLRTGNLVWESTPFDYPWSSGGFGAYAVQSAYGILYRQAYDGVYAFNWTNGQLLWHFISYAPPFETPYTDENGTSVYSFNGGGFVADGKLYTYNTEHTPTYPRTRGWKLYCIDAFTGEGIWNITGAMSPGAVADGYLVNGNPDDGYVYSFGKGKSATTVSAPQTQITLGEKIMISGTVMDLSPAQPNTPCVSKESMTTQMEYLHMQLPIDGV
jgi:outer membrane protein assembly factor BamB